MSDESSAPQPSSTALTDDDYERIHAVIAETAHGRWFLAEYARRNRNADTTLLLAAIERLEAEIRSREQPAAEPVSTSHREEIVDAIAEARENLLRIKPEAGDRGKTDDVAADADTPDDIPAGPAQADSLNGNVFGKGERDEPPVAEDAGPPVVVGWQFVKNPALELRSPAPTVVAPAAVFAEVVSRHEEIAAGPPAVERAATNGAAGPHHETPIPHAAFDQTRDEEPAPVRPVPASTPEILPPETHAKNPDWMSALAPPLTVPGAFLFGGETAPENEFVFKPAIVEPRNTRPPVPVRRDGTAPGTARSPQTGTRPPAGDPLAPINALSDEEKIALFS